MTVGSKEWCRAARAVGPLWDPPVRCYHCGKGFASNERCAYCNEPNIMQLKVMEYDSMFQPDNRHTRRQVTTTTVYLLTPMRYAALLRYLAGGWMPPWIAAHEGRSSARSVRAIRNIVESEGA